MTSIGLEKTASPPAPESREVSEMLTSDLLYLTGLAFFLTHELDASYRHEWRFFAQPFDVHDETSYRVFVVLHVPVFVLLVYYWNSQSWQLGTDSFLVAHAFLHWSLRNHPLVDFDNWFSRIWIYGGALIAGVHLVVLLL